MKTHSIIIGILIILAIFLSTSLYLQKEQDDIVIIPVNNIDYSTSTPITATSTSTKPTSQQTFPKQVTLSTLNNYEFPDKTVLSITEINDSRCPINVNCIWAGNILVKFSLKKENTYEDFELKYDSSIEKSEYSYKGYNIKISNVKPDKGSDSQIVKKSDYRITITISK